MAIADLIAQGKKKAEAEAAKKAEEAEQEIETKRAVYLKTLETACSTVLGVEIDPASVTWTRDGNRSLPFAEIDRFQFTLAFRMGTHLMAPMDNAVCLSALCEGCGVRVYSEHMGPEKNHSYTSKPASTMLARIVGKPPSLWGQESPYYSSNIGGSKEHKCDRRKAVLVDERSGAERILASSPDDKVSVLQEALRALGYKVIIQLARP